MEVLSFNDRYVLSTGEDDPKSNELVRFSLDGKFVDGTGEPVNDYLDSLREQGYEGASVKKYLAIYGMLEHEDMSEIVQIQVPPTSVSRFTRHQINEGVRISRLRAQGQEVVESSRIKLTQFKQKGKSSQYAMIDFSSAD